MTEAATIAAWYVVAGLLVGSWWWRYGEDRRLRVYFIKAAFWPLAFIALGYWLVLRLLTAWK